MSKEHEKSDRLVVIGGDAAGMTAASKVRRMQPDREIVVIERSQHTSYAACGMPYLISGEVSDPEDLIARSPKEFRDTYKIDVRTEHEAIRLDPSTRTVWMQDLSSGKESELVYGDLLIATGASPIRPDLPGLDLDGVMGLSTLDTGLGLLERVRREPPGHVVVVGGGYIGIEMAEVFREIGSKVHLIDMASQVMATLDADMAIVIQEAMVESGVTLSLGETLGEVRAGSEASALTVQTSGDHYPADLVILGMGVRPNSELAREAGLELGPKGAISVNDRMQTSDPHIWAAGDCADSLHRVTGERTWIALGTVANKHGLVAGTNIGGGDVHFPGVVGTAITRYRDLEIARSGLSVTEAENSGMNVESRTITSRTRAGYMPGSEEIHVKLVAAPDGRLLGGQIVGGVGSGKRIDTVAAALTAGLSVKDLLWMDLSYAPPFSPVWDPVQMAARQFDKKQPHREIE
ncbi:MAG: FAD-dependent oxidoreductase [Balneolaceae bacterium]